MRWLDAYLIGLFCHYHVPVRLQLKCVSLSGIKGQPLEYGGQVSIIKLAVEWTDDLNIGIVLGTEGEGSIEGGRHVEFPLFPEGAERGLAVSTVEMVADLGEFLARQQRILFELAHSSECIGTDRAGLPPSWGPLRFSSGCY